MPPNVDLATPVAGWAPNMTDAQLADFIKQTQALLFDANTKLSIAQAVQTARATAKANGPPVV